ncbi:MAG: radical SAM protein [Phycisphaerales bacterium]
MKILFIVYEEPANPVSYPLGVGLLSALLKTRGHDVSGLYVRESLDAAALDAIAARVRAAAPSLVAFSCTSPAFPFIRQIAERLRRQTGIATICGGPHPTLYPEETLRTPGIDYVCVGEGEVSFPAFVESFERGSDCSSLAGIWHLDDRNGVVANRLPPLVQDLDALPWIDYDVFGEEFLRTLTCDGWLRHLTSRGCPYSCSYCHTPMFRKVYSEGIGVPERSLGYIRFRSCDSIIEELSVLVERYDLRVLNFMDDLFCMKKARVLEFCRKFQERLPKHVGYSIQTHLQHLDEEVVDALRQSRCVRVVVGVESGSPRMLKLFNRNVEPDAMRRALSLLRRADFPLGTWTLNMLGNPGETLEEMLETLALNAQCLMERVKINIMAPYPKSALYDFCVEQDLFSQDPDDVRFADRSVTKLKFPARELSFLEKLFDVGHWYLNVLAPLGVADVYRPLIEEVQRVGPGRWSEVRSRYVEMDREVSEKLSKRSLRHYMPVLKGKVTTNVFGVSGLRSNWTGDACESTLSQDARCRTRSVSECAPGRPVR